MPEIQGRAKQVLKPKKMKRRCSADPMRHALRGELQDRVRARLDALSPLHRDIVILHELHGLTYGECAGALAFRSAL
jgi:DNA-directed RNA polymerase specialized sigma24 family protein